MSKRNAVRKCGEKYTYNGEHYILAQVGVFMVCLVCIEDGNRWEDPIGVVCYENITPEEWESISTEGKFRRVP